MENNTNAQVSGMSPASNIGGRWTGWAPRVKSLLRIVASLMFMSVGAIKLFAFPVGIPPAGGAVPLLSLLGLAGVLEVFGGGLLLIGLFTRPIAFLLAGEMAVAYFMGHFPSGWWPGLNGGQPAILYCFIWLYFSAAGSGPWSVDARLKKK